MGVDIIDGGYITYIYSANPFAVSSFPPQSCRGPLIMLDSIGPTFRVQRDATYKAHRKDRKFADQKAFITTTRVRELRERIRDDPRVRTARVEGLEADDLLALAAWRFKSVSAMAVDKDLLQIEGIRLFDVRGEEITIPRFQKRLPKSLQKTPLQAEHIPLILALLGDKSDNVPKIVQRGDLWRVWSIVWGNDDPWKEAYNHYGQRFLKNLYCVILPDPSLFKLSPKEVWRRCQAGEWDRRMLKELSPEMKKEVKSWSLQG